MAFELVTYTELRGVLELKSPTIQEYKPLQVLKASVEKAIENFIGRELESKARTEVVHLSPMGTKMVPLKGLPIASVATVTVTDAYGNIETLTEQTDFSIAAFGLRIFSKIKDAQVSVTYTGGYAQADLPAAISRAALMQTVYEYKKAPHLGAETVTTEGGTIAYPELGLLKHVKELLFLHTHPLKEALLG